MKKTKILIIDDELYIVSALRFILKGLCFEVETADNCESAWNYIVRSQQIDEPVDLAITDIQMTGKTGFELIEQIHRQKYPISILIITGFVSSEIEAKIRQIDCEYIEKPFAPEELLSKINMILNKRLQKANEHPTKQGLQAI